MENSALLHRPLTIFVHRASECLTDHESHGDGLICFSLLNGLAECGHQVYAYANTAPVHRCSPNLHIKTGQHRVPANSLGPWEQAWRAEQWMNKLEATITFDLVWRMHPYGGGCPTVPQTSGKPLVVGPLFYGWPAPPGGTPKSGRPRLGIGLQRIVGPIAERGWQRTLSQATLILCATAPHAALVHRQHPSADVRELPVIVDPPPGTAARSGHSGRLSLLFVANLVPNKNPQVFCEMILRLRASGVDATGTLLGDGPERLALEAYCAANGLSKFVCFRGKVANRAVYEALADADFLVSVSDGEPYGRGIAEAMSVGTPAICHNSGGPADFINDGVNGLLVDTLTADAYTARLERALAAPNAWDFLSAGAVHSAQNWRTEAVLDRLEEALYAVVGKQVQRQL